jgi:hypothetical protein
MTTIKKLLVVILAILNMVAFIGLGKIMCVALIFAYTITIFVHAVKQYKVVEHDLGVFILSLSTAFNILKIATEKEELIEKATLYEPITCAVISAVSLVCFIALYKEK